MKSLFRNDWLEWIFCWNFHLNIDETLIFHLDSCCIKRSRKIEHFFSNVWRDHECRAWARFRLFFKKRHREILDTWRVTKFWDRRFYFVDKFRNLFESWKRLNEFSFSLCTKHDDDFDRKCRVWIRELRTRTFDEDEN